MNTQPIFGYLFKDLTAAAGGSIPSGLESILTSFLVNLAGNRHPLYSGYGNIPGEGIQNPEYREFSDFFIKAASDIKDEINGRAEKDPGFRKSLEVLTSKIEEAAPGSVPEPDDIWAVFFPEGVGISDNPEEKMLQLKKKRTVEILETNPEPVSDPGREILFTSNILLTLPPDGTDYDTLDLPGDLIDKLKKTREEEQLFFFDHPVQIGIKPENNEILYGLKGLDNTCRWEKLHGYMDPDAKLTCVLSISVTHSGLHRIARDYIRHEMERYGSFENIEVYIFTEEDTRALAEKILIHGSTNREAELIKRIFGVDGEYGRHYSFLKAISAFWKVFINDRIKATFKIDLDQIFPEDELKEQTGKSAFEHFKTPLWGSTGVAASGNRVDLGMIAGALVNEKDIKKGIFTPDVKFNYPEKLTPEERIFNSKLMMGFSTEAELMTRYGENGIDGERRCIQRIHVTGGTNGILVSHLMKYRPFTPSFIGRAEDQCYILSVLCSTGTKLAYLHEDGLIMRHDKEAFAAGAIKAAAFGSTIGDYIRIIYFSKYAEILTDGDIEKIKETIDPFTGCFVSKIPVTIVYIRYALKALGIFRNRNSRDGEVFLRQGRKRIQAAVNFTEGDDSQLSRQLNAEKAGWDYYYDILDSFEKALKESSVRAAELQEKAVGLLANCRVNR